MVAAQDSSAVPVVDLTWDEAHAVSVLRSACTSSGFFYLRNHGIEDLVERHFEETRKFFAVPMERKMDIMVDHHHRGYTPFDYETLDPAAQKAPDNKEGMYYGREVAPDSPHAGKPFEGPNQWPDPELLPEFRPVMEDAFREFLALGRRTLRLLALALDLPPTWFLDRFQRPLVTLRPLHYNDVKSDPDEGIYGCGAHTDYGVLTLLATDGTPGLQIRKEAAWEDVPSLPGTIIVNLGDMLQMWTRGKYKSTMHRVINKTGSERYSTAFFMEPDFDVVIDAKDFPACQSQGSLPAAPAITSGQYLINRYKATQLSAATPDFEKSGAKAQAVY